MHKVNYLLCQIPNFPPFTRPTWKREREEKVPVRVCCSFPTFKVILSLEFPHLRRMWEGTVTPAWSGLGRFHCCVWQTPLKSLLRGRFNHVSSLTRHIQEPSKKFKSKKDPKTTKYMKLHELPNCFPMLSSGRSSQILFPDYFQESCVCFLGSLYIPASVSTLYLMKLDCRGGPRGIWP